MLGLKWPLIGLWRRKAWLVVDNLDYIEWDLSKPKRGRKPSGNAKSGAQRSREYRARQKAKRAE